jgi:hypothetical protein
VKRRTRTRVPGPDGTTLLGYRDEATAAVTVYDLDGDEWTITRTNSPRRAVRYRITDTDGESIAGASIRRLIGHAQRAGARFFPWTTDPDEADS